MTGLAGCQVVVGCARIRVYDAARGEVGVVLDNYKS